MASPIATCRQRIGDRLGSLSIRTKIAAGVLWLLFCFGGVVIFAVRARLAVVMWEEHRDKAISTALDVEQQIATALSRPLPAELRTRIRRRAEIDHDLAYIVVLSGSQAVLADTFDHGCPPGLLGANSVAAGQPFRMAVLDTAHGPVWDVAVPLRLGKAGTVRVGISQSHAQRVIQSVTSFLLLLTGAAAILGALGACLLTSLIVNPILQLATASEAIRTGNLQPRVSVNGADEVGRLAASFNAMADALARSRGEIEEVNQQLVRRNTGLLVLIAVAGAVSRSLHLDDILSRALEEVRLLLKVKVGWILLKADGGRLTLAAASGFSEAFSPEVIETMPEHCACRQTLAGGQARVVDASPVCLRGGLEAARRAGLECHASVPLTAKDNVLGIMNLAYPSDRRLGDEDLQLLNSVGRQIGMAVENVRLYEDLRRKEVQLISAHEEERARVARELHDEAGQSLTALLLQLGSLAELLPPGADQAQRRLAELEVLTAGIVAELRRLMMDLRPTLLDDLGLIPAIQSFAETQLERAGVKVAIDVQGSKRKLIPAVETALFRICQEAITNIARHAAAKNGRIELRFKESSVDTRISDDGLGFDAVNSRGSWRTFGLLGIEERVAILGGTLQIDSRPGQGTQIHFEVPLPVMQR